jgi:hypothetical protein
VRQTSGGGYGRNVVSMAQAARIALVLPDAVEGERRGNRSWAVNGKTFAWKRPFSKADIRRFGDRTPPDGPILAVRVADLHEKEAILAELHDGVFTIPHFDGYAALLLDLPSCRRSIVKELLVLAWSTVAPTEIADAYLRRHPVGGRAEGV